MPVEYIANIFILIILISSALSMMCAKDLMSATIASGVFSLALVAEYVILAAPDVAMTEAAVGCGMSTVLLLLTIFYVGNDSSEKNVSYTLPVIAAGFLLGMMSAVFISAPSIGSSESPAYLGVSADYIARAGAETGVPNMVTSVLASYRGVDTFGEVMVVFCAAIIVFALLSVRDAAFAETHNEGGRRHAS